MRESLFEKVFGKQFAMVLIKRLRHSCFPVSFFKELKILFAQNTHQEQSPRGFLEKRSSSCHRDDYQILLMLI